MMPKVCHILLPAFVLLFVTSLMPTTVVNGAKILGLFAHPSESHFNVMRSVFKELAKRNHNVTVYSSHRLDERVENLQEIIIEPEYPFWREVQKTASGKTDLLELSKLPASTLQRALGAAGAAATDYFLSHAAVQQLLQLTTEQFDFDLIVVDLFYTESLLALGHVHGTPTVGIISSNFEDYMQHVLESLVPMACVPFEFETPNGAEAVVATNSFWQRLSYIRDCISRRKLFAKVHLDAQQKIVNKYFGHLESPPPTVPQLQASLAVLLLNNHVPLLTPRPLLPNIIPAGGLHIRPPRELPWHVRRFLDESRVGVIYINFGNEQLCAELPSARLQTLFQVLGERRERVLWTCHDVDSLEGMPKNFMLQHMVPQTDILAHPHIKAFIMNGNLLSLQEGIMRHVPMLGVPLFTEEKHNMELAVRLEFAIQLTYSNFTATAINWALEALLYQNNYAVQIRQVATAFRDRPLGALETAIYWMDYVLRHNGGAQIRTRGVATSSSQLHLFDLFVFYFAMAVLFVAGVVGLYFLMLLVWRHRQTKKLYNKLS